MKKIFTLGLLVAPIFLFSQQVARNLTAANGTFIGFYEYKPTDYNANPTTKYPLIIFLHGIGERGDGVYNLPLVLANGVPKNINQGHPMRFFWNGKWETFLVLSPQLSNIYGDWPNFYVEEMIKYAKSNMRVDTNRIILTGLSLGGGGVWRFASQSPGNAQQLAAIAPVCGTCAMSNACAISGSNLPVWAFHAQNDGVVGVGCTTSSILSINNCNPSVKPLMTIYPDGGHGIWDRAYDTNYGWQNINMYEWFLGQNKSLPANTLPTARAGQDISTTTESGNISLSGSASNDVDGNIARYVWRKSSGPSGVVLNNPVSTDGVTSVSGLSSAGTYVFQLTVFDNRGGASSDEVTVVVTPGSGLSNSAPIAKAGNDQAITLPSNNVTLDGSGSYDPDGSVTSWSWSKISGPTQYSINSPQSISTSITGLAQGTYGFVLTVTDNAGVTGKDTINVMVNASVVPAPPPPTNQPPVSNAGANTTINLPANSVSLNGSASYDPDGSIVAYQWSKIGGPDFYNSSNLNSSALSVSNLVTGQYTFQLRVTDNSGTGAVSFVVITVNPPVANQAPLANAGNDISLVLPTNTAILNGSSSSDPDGSIVSYTWSKLSGPASGTIVSPGTANSNLTNLVAGTYQFRLEIKDNGGLSAIDDITVQVNSAVVNPPTDGSNQSPVANAGGNASISLPTNSFQLNANGSYDPDGSIVDYRWNQISGLNGHSTTNLNSVTASLSNLSEGIYIFMLTVIDNSGKMGFDYLTLTVNPAGVAPSNQVPIADAGVSTSITLPVNSVILDGTRSTDPDGTILHWNWSKLSGPAGGTILNNSIASTTVSSLVAGNYQFKVTVTDNAGASSSAIVNVIVNNAPLSAVPIAKAGSDLYISLPNNSAQLNGYSSYDPDGVIQNWKWAKISGPAGDVIANPDAGFTSVTGLTAGTYTYSFVVTDNSGQLAVDTVAIIVSATAGQSAQQTLITDFSVQSTAKLLAYPNPAIQSVNLRISSSVNGKGKLSVFDLTGRLVRTIEFTKLNDFIDTRLDISDLKSGVYVVEVILDQKNKMTTRFIKK